MGIGIPLLQVRKHGRATEEQARGNGAGPHGGGGVGARGRRGGGLAARRDVADLGADRLGEGGELGLERLAVVAGGRLDGRLVRGDLGAGLARDGGDLGGDARLDGRELAGGVGGGRRGLGQDTAGDGLEDRGHSGGDGVGEGNVLGLWGVSVGVGVGLVGGRTAARVAKATTTAVKRMLAVVELLGLRW